MLKKFRLIVHILAGSANLAKKQTFDVAHRHIKFENVTLVAFFSRQWKLIREKIGQKIDKREKLKKVR